MPFWQYIFPDEKVVEKWILAWQKAVDLILKHFLVICQSVIIIVLQRQNNDFWRRHYGIWIFIGVVINVTGKKDQQKQNTDTQKPQSAQGYKLFGL